MMRRRWCWAIALVAAGCGGRHGANVPSAEPSTPALATRSAPDRLFGIVLRQRLDTGALSGTRCITGREFALERGYRVTRDDVLLSVYDEHQDTTAVLAALDSFTACRGRTREFHATAIVTLSDSVVGHVMLYWPDGDAPSYDRMVATLAEMYGEPHQNSWGVRYWSSDSMKLVVNQRGMYGDGTAITLSDARPCERYEHLVHVNNRRDRRYGTCWDKPRRLDPAEIFTERPIALADSDLSASGIAYRADSGDVHRRLGAPMSTDSGSWWYPGIRIWFTDGRVRMVALTTPASATVRGLRVGDHVARAKTLYGTPCMREAWIYCTDGRDGEGMMLYVKDLHITTIRVGKVFTVQ